MAITNYLVHFKTKDTYDQTVVDNPLRNDAVAFIQDATIIRTHGTDYHCGSGPVALKSELATVATTGSYNDLIDKPENSDKVYIIDASSLGDIISDTGAWTGTPVSEIITNIEGKAVYLLIGNEPNQNIIPVGAQIVNGSVILYGSVLQIDITLQISSENTYVFSKQENITLNDASQVNIGNVNLGTAFEDGTVTSISLSNFGVTATTQELNYCDGVTSNIQTQLNGKAASSHTHNASDINAGTLNIARIPTGTSATTVALGNHTHSDYLSTSGGTINGSPLTIEDNLYVHGTIYGNRGLTLSAYYGAQSVVTIGHDEFLYNDAYILTSDNYSDYITTTDTKNTTGTSNSTSKLYLAGGTSQSSTGVQTYSNNAVYTQSGQLYATQMNATNGFYETSDARLKNFKDDIKALDTVDQIPTKYFTWKEDENQESQIGTSAQEVEKLYPELVSKIEDDTLTVDYAKLSIIALAAIKELKTEIQSLKEEIKQLKLK